MDGSRRVRVAFAVVCAHPSERGAGKNKIVCHTENQR